MSALPSLWIEVESQREEVYRHAQELASRLELSIFPVDAQPPAVDGDDDGDRSLRLVLRDERLELRGQHDRPGRGLSVDFASLLRRQSSRGGGRSQKQPLVKAIGKHTPFVFDATAGLGQDAALLASMGYQVLAAERSPIIFALLEDGLHRALADAVVAKSLGGRLSIINADAKDLLLRSSIDESSSISNPIQITDFLNLPSAVYIDPMFPPKRKTSALAKKSIRMVRQIVGDDDDAAALLQLARTRAARVIVKRPTYAPPLAEDASISFPGKLVRYDVYLKTSPKAAERTS